MIVGPGPPAFTAQAVDAGWTPLINEQPEAGLGHSVALAARQASDGGADALVLLLADMPLVSADIIAMLLAHGPVTQPMAARYPGGRPGVPARFPADMLPALSRLHGDRGAGSLLAARSDLHWVEMTDNQRLDVDDPESLARADMLLSRPGHPE